MRVFLTGATGWIGSAIARDLLKAGHSVIGLARSSDKGRALSAAGVQPRLGSLGDLDVLRAAADEADGIVHTAFGLDLSRIEELAAEDRLAIEALGDVLAGSRRPLIVTGGFGLLPAGETFTEASRPLPIPGFPRVSEQAAFALAERGVHASVVRNPRSVHGRGERHGFVPMLATLARDKGVSAFVGDGRNLWPSVHRLDAATVYRLALEHQACGQAFHAVAEAGVPFRRIAEAIGHQVGVPAVSLSPAQAAQHFGPLSAWAAGNGPASSEATQALLGWAPRFPDLVSDIERPDYGDPAEPADAA